MTRDAANAIRLILIAVNLFTAGIVGGPVAIMAALLACFCAYRIGGDA